MFDELKRIRTPFKIILDHVYLGNKVKPGKAY